jgi:hypothetical protein
LAWKRKIIQNIADKRIDFQEASVSPANLKPMGPVTLGYSQSRVYSRTSWLPPEYDLNEINRIADTESLVARAFNKKSTLMFKEGFSYIGKDQEEIAYLKKRFNEIAFVTNIPHSDLLKRIGQSLVATSNAFLVKVRGDKSSSGQPRKNASGKQLKPIAGYFPAAPETMKPRIDPKTGVIIQWKQELPNGNYKEFEADDVIHFYISRREGFTFGVPHIIPVIDDIKTLRQIEENVDLMLYQHLFPIFHYTVGTETAPAGYTEAGEREIDVAKTQLQYMPAEGGIVTPERHKLELIGAENKVVRAEQYLEYFKKRVVAGLGISMLDLGDGESSNRSTANVMSRALIDSVKDIQESLETQWYHNVIKELLLESEYGEDILNEEAQVHLKFNEIDIFSKQEQEKHALELFKNNGITHDEFRIMLGKEPINIPLSAQDKNPVDFPEWNLTYWKLIEEPSYLIRQIGNPWNVGAITSSTIGGSAITPEHVKRATSETVKNEPLLKIAPIPVMQDNLISSMYEILSVDISHAIDKSIKEQGKVDLAFIESYIGIWNKDLKVKIIKLVNTKFIQGFNDETNGLAYKASSSIVFGKANIISHLDIVFDNLHQAIVNSISFVNATLNNNKNFTKLEYINDINKMLNSVKQRTNPMWKTELQRAYNYGRLLGAKFEGYDECEYVTDNCCEQCKQHNTKILKIIEESIDTIAPHHPNCICSLTKRLINK